MKILIAPDKFKGVLSAREVAENIAAGLRDVAPSCKIDIMPMADGGEGTAEVLCAALGCEWRECAAHDALGRPITARYGWITNRGLAIMEMSEAAGMRRLQPNEYNIDRASTYGVGEMILAAAGAGARDIIVGLGGSATNDGGVGMARALGFRFLAAPASTELEPSNQSSSENKRDGEREAEEVDESVSALSELTKIERPVSSALPQDVRIVAAVDVRNPLLGWDGATRVFGPQKGATAENSDLLEKGLARLADVAAAEFGHDFRDVPGAGAAGGLGFGLMTFCGAELHSGFTIVADAVDLRRRIEAVDFVITGEGKLDCQTPQGKTPAGVAGLARVSGKKVYAIVGYAEPDAAAQSLFDRVWSVSDSPKLDPGAIARAGEMLHSKARQAAIDLGLATSY